MPIKIPIIMAMIPTNKGITIKAATISDTFFLLIIIDISDTPTVNIPVFIILVPSSVISFSTIGSYLPLFSP